MGELTKLVTEKTGKLSFADAVLISVGTPLVDQGFRMVGVGNSGLLPNALKFGGALVTQKFGGNIGKLLATSMLVSATTGLLDTYAPALTGARKSSSSNVQVVGGSDSNQGLLPGMVI